MRKVDLFYNPYIQKTSLWVDGDEYTHTSRRISEFITGRPMEQWIIDYSISYKHWDGFLPELTDELNDDNLDLVFWGIKEDYDFFSTGIKQTYEDVRKQGFEPDCCRLSWKSKYEPEDMLNLLRQFVREKLGMLTTQMEIIRMESICDKFEREDVMEVDELRESIKSITGLLQDIVASCGTEKLQNYWNGAARQFNRICEEGR